ncbi:nuclease-related domain-containing protein [Actinacidiphila reveromycinica]|uniref:nuclease-related domain-containing protein n=1 Tax=Actinacidiphila reveromycinica TaxID=659352 RepID=UPI0019203D81|nr:nuclease-related domain-containing protein [Streptomyces sp. SN-593]
MWWLPPAVVIGYGVLLITWRMLPSARVLALAAGAALPTLLARRIYKVGPEVRRWRVGADGERRTAALLAPLTWDGWHVVHDRAIPGGGRANLDHVALLPDGESAVLIDTKAWTARATVTMRRGTAYCGSRSLAETIKTTRWEAKQTSLALGVPVTPLIAVHGAKVARGRLSLGDGLVIVSAGRLRSELRRIPVQRDPQAARHLAVRAEGALPRYIDQKRTATHAQ